MVDIQTLRRELKEIQDHFPTWTLDNAFVHWFLRAFLVTDDEVAARSVTGVSHDKGVDAVYTDAAVGKVFVLQGKCHFTNKAPQEKRADILDFARLSQRLSDSDAVFAAYKENIDPLVGRKLVEAREQIRKRRFSLHLYYVTTGACSSPLKDEAEAETAQANCSADISILDRKEILTLLTDYLRGAAPPVPFLDLPIDPRGLVGSDGVIQRFDQKTDIESWILSMSGRDVGHLYKIAGDRLFARNIRGFLGDTAINDGMKDTIKESPENFWYFNNGITIVCDSARKTAERGQAVLRVSNPQIINGQQTSRTLHKNAEQKASVLVRVISIPRGKGSQETQFERLVSSIVAATNWQNAILPSDLRSNDARQVRLERDLAKLRYHYLRKRQTKGEAKRQLGNQYWFRIKKEELAQAVAACEFDPEVVRSGKEGLFKAPYYDEIFNNRLVFHYLAAYWLSRVVKNNASGFPDRAYAKWLVLHFVWKRLSKALLQKGVSTAFRSECERNRWNRHLDTAVSQIYLATLKFYKTKRGKGAKAVDISNFFYRSKQHLAFETFWLSKANNRRTKVKRNLARFLDEMKKAAQ
ncbi:MAG TPA: AIPR family protein [Candidatus Acidoferrales bacterium]